ncbi:hypothetical protein NC99_28900 [Sunxiuqinia dokdonensis]|uniref:Uncharacterized protein n=1 Tax=Sunxiuqinia dokdonensis TaxID=1409788 RepID=A0A0L8V7W4_9BACT|nr:hypothetical protein NC99_28900 [Sunxiuqinia dokdonensis]
MILLAKLAIRQTYRTFLNENCSKRQTLFPDGLTFIPIFEHSKIRT